MRDDFGLLNALEFDSLFAMDDPAERAGLQLDQICDPLDGRVYATDDADGLISSYDLAKKVSDQLYKWQQQLRDRLGRLACGPEKTQRVRGEFKVCTVEKPDDKWDQSTLKRAWEKFPIYRDQILKIAEIGVQKVEFKKALATSGPTDFENFVKLVDSARSESTSLPSIKVEADVKPPAKFPPF